MKQKFWKVHSNGNDFIFVQDCSWSTDLIAKLCDRRRGIGADGVLVLRNRPLSMRIFNADGSEAAMCGNGLRCFMLMARMLNFASPQQIIETLGGKIEVKETCSNPFVCGYFVNVEEKDSLLCVSGTRHLVLFEPMNEAKGAALEKELDCNIDFAEVIDRNTIRVATWERGVGRTDACGTGACASTYAAWKKGFVEGDVTVLFRIESVLCRADENQVWTEGQAVCVYEGEIELDNRGTDSFDSAVTEENAGDCTC